MTTRNLRTDLALAAYAVSLGYVLRRYDGRPIYDATFVDGIPGDPVSFVLLANATHRDITVWLTARGWRVAELGADGTYPPPAPADFHIQLRPALEAGLALATRR